LRRLTSLSETEASKSLSKNNRGTPCHVTLLFASSSQVLVAGGREFSAPPIFMTQLIIFFGVKK